MFAVSVRKYFTKPALCLFGLWCFAINAAAAESDAQPVAIAIHGGAGTIRPEEMTPEKETAYRAALSEALRAGYEVLQNGGTSLDAVVSAITVLEDAPLFNAGKGAVFTNDGRNELDAAIMDGASLNAGAVAAVSSIKNPIKLARLVMEESPHVLLIGAGAKTFADEHGIETAPAEYFYTERRWQQLKKAQQEKAEQGAEFKQQSTLKTEDHFGTVGAVALDKHGNLAAGTSTGGMTNKRFGRVGDSPIIGAGTYASNKSSAISATGHGEYFMRSVVAHDIAALMEYRGYSLEAAAYRVVKEKLVDLNGGGGVIAIDREGNISMQFNTAGMYRGSVNTDGEYYTAIYSEEIEASLKADQAAQSGD